MGWRIAIVLSACVVVHGVAPANADEEAPTPWSEGVTDTQKTTAQARLEAGNALFLQSKWIEALDEYRQAVAAWDHPAIRFNMVRCLIQLERPVEAYDNLELALQYGAAPLEESVYTEAQAYQKLLLGQIAEIEVSCKQAGTKVTLDGQPLVTCPGSERRRLPPGQHQLVGTKDGFLTLTRDVVLLPGKEEAVVVELRPLKEGAVITHRWATWKPWAVLGGGVVLGGLGGLVQLRASTDLDRYEEAFAAQCVDPITREPGCTSDPVADQKRTALIENKVAIGMMVAGAATVVSGAILLVLNRGRTTYPAERAKVGVAPLPDGGATVSLGLDF